MRHRSKHSLIRSDVFLKQSALCNEKGAALIVALFIVALVTTLSTIMLMRFERDLRATSFLHRHNQAYGYAEGSLAWAIDQLRNDWERRKNNQVIDATPIRSPENEVNGYHIQSTIYDMQARFNINNLSELESRDDFKRLLKVVVPDLAPAKGAALTKNISEWIMPGNQETEVDRFYLSLKKPYRAAHRLMSNISELNLVKEMTPALFAALKPYLIALPATTSINVQTAPPEVLMTLGNDMTIDVAKAIFNLREKAPFTSIDSFKNLEILKNRTISDKKITVHSQYFLVETSVAIESQTLLIYTLLERLENDSKAIVNILWQSKGIW